MSLLVPAPDGLHVAAASHDRTIRLFDLATREPAALLGGLKKPAVSVAFLPDGEHLISVGLDNSAQLWDIHEEKPRAALWGVGEESFAGVAVFRGRQPHRGRPGRRPDPRLGSRPLIAGVLATLAIALARPSGTAAVGGVHRAVLDNGLTVLVAEEPGIAPRHRGGGVQGGGAQRNRGHHRTRPLRRAHDLSGDEEVPRPRVGRLDHAPGWPHECLHLDRPDLLRLDPGARRARPPPERRGGTDGGGHLRPGGLPQGADERPRRAAVVRRPPVASLRRGARGLVRDPPLPQQHDRLAVGRRGADAGRRLRRSTGATTSPTTQSSWWPGT